MKELWICHHKSVEWAVLLSQHAGAPSEPGEVKLSCQTEWQEEHWKLELSRALAQPFPGESWVLQGQQVGYILHSTPDCNLHTAETYFQSQCNHNPSLTNLWLVKMWHWTKEGVKRGVPSQHSSCFLHINQQHGQKFWNIIKYSSGSWLAQYPSQLWLVPPVCRTLGSGGNLPTLFCRSKWKYQAKSHTWRSWFLVFLWWDNFQEDLQC